MFEFFELALSSSNYSIPDRKEAPIGTPMGFYPLTLRLSIKKRLVTNLKRTFGKSGDLII